MSRPRLASFLTFVVFFAFYVPFVARGLLPADAGEFQVVAPLLGVAHPPGFPFYTLLGKLFITIVPFGTPAYRLNLLSAVLAALTLTIVAETARALTGSRVAGLLAAAGLGASTTFWSQATTANVRMLTALCAAACLLALALLRNSKLQTANSKSLISSRYSLLFFFALGLGISHHASLAFMGAVFGLYWLVLVFERGQSAVEAGNPGGWGGWRAWLKLGAAFAAPFLFDLYLPLRGAAGAFLAPPHLATLSGFLEHVLARGFEGDFFYFAHWKDLSDRLAVLGNILTFQFNPWLLAGMGLGGLLALRREGRLFALLAGAFAIHSFVAVTYRAPQTVEYMLPGYVVLAVALGYGMRDGGQGLRVRGYGLRFTPYVLQISFAVAALLLFVRNAPSYAGLAGDDSTREYVAGVLEAAPARAVVLASWHWATPMWYLQRVEGARPDVEVQYVFPQGESLAQNWVEAIAANVQARPVVVTSFYAAEFQAAGYRFAPLGAAWLASAAPFTASPISLSPVGATFGGRWRLAGYTLATSAARPGETLPVIAAWVTPDAPEDMNFFVQLIGPDGALYGQADVSHAAAREAASEWLIERYLITVRPDAPPGDYALVAGAYQPDGSRLTVGEGGQDVQPLETIRVGLADQPPPTVHPVLRPAFGTRLIGYDYDRSLPDSTRLYLHWRLGSGAERATVWAGGSPYAELDLPAGPGYLTTTVDLLPEASRLQVVLGAGRTPGLLDWRTYGLADPGNDDRYVALGGAIVLTRARVTREGQGSVRVDLDLRSARALTEDDIVKVDAIGPGYAWRAESDSVPAGGAIPTLKWVAGSVIHDRHRLTIPAGVAGGMARLEMAAYDHFTGRVLPILDPRLALLGPTVPLGEVEVAP